MIVVMWCNDLRVSDNEKKNLYYAQNAYLLLEAYTPLVIVYDADSEYIEEYIYIWSYHTMHA